MKSVLLIGQSNMAGRGYLHEVTPIYNENIFMLRNGRWQIMTEEAVPSMNGIRKVLYFAMQSVRQNSPWKTVS